MIFFHWTKCFNKNLHVFPWFWATSENFVQENGFWTFAWNGRKSYIYLSSTWDEFIYFFLFEMLLKMINGFIRKWNSVWTDKLMYIKIQNTCATYRLLQNSMATATKFQLELNLQKIKQFLRIFWKKGSQWHLASRCLHFISFFFSHATDKYRIQLSIFLTFHKQWFDPFFKPLFVVASRIFFSSFSSFSSSSSYYFLCVMCPS